MDIIYAFRRNHEHYIITRALRPAGRLVERSDELRIVPEQGQFRKVHGKPVLMKQPRKNLIVLFQHGLDPQFPVSYILEMSVMILVLARITAELPVGTAIEYRPAFKAGFDTCKVFYQSVFSHSISVLRPICRIFFA